MKRLIASGLSALLLGAVSAGALNAQTTTGNPRMTSPSGGTGTSVNYPFGTRIYSNGAIVNFSNLAVPTVLLMGMAHLLAIPLVLLVKSFSVIRLPQLSMSQNWRVLLTLLTLPYRRLTILRLTT